jgi:hypothetical protein
MQKGKEGEGGHLVVHGASQPFYIGSSPLLENDDGDPS